MVMGLANQTADGRGGLAASQNKRQCHGDNRVEGYCRRHADKHTDGHSRGDIARISLKIFDPDKKCF